MKLECFQCAALFYLNMVCYHIRITEDASNLCTITMPRRKYRYKSLTMGVINLPEVFQHKINDLFQGF